MGTTTDYLSDDTECFECGEESAKTSWDCEPVCYRCARHNFEDLVATGGGLDDLSFHFDDDPILLFG